MLSPKGIAREQSPHNIIVSGTFIIFVIPIKTSGYIINRIIVTK